MLSTVSFFYYHVNQKIHSAVIDAYKTTGSIIDYSVRQKMAFYLSLARSMASKNITTEFLEGLEEKDSTNSADKNNFAANRFEKANNKGVNVFDTRSFLSQDGIYGKDSSIVDIQIVDKTGKIAGSQDFNNKRNVQEEEWWRASYNKGKVKDIIWFNESSEYSKRSKELSFIVPIENKNDKFLGMLKMDVSVESFSTAFSAVVNSPSLKDFKAFITDSHGYILSSSSPIDTSYDKERIEEMLCKLPSAGKTWMISSSSCLFNGKTLIVLARDHLWESSKDSGSLKVFITIPFEDNLKIGRVLVIKSLLLFLALWVFLTPVLYLISRQPQKRKDTIEENTFLIESIFKKFEVREYIRKGAGVFTNGRQNNMKNENFNEKCRKLYAESILESMIDAVIIIENGKIKFVNKIVTNLLGYELGELIGKPFEFLFCKDGKNFDEQIYKDVKQYGYVKNIEIFCEAKNKSVIPVKVTMMVMRHAVISSAPAGKDIAERGADTSDCENYICILKDAKELDIIMKNDSQSIKEIEDFSQELQEKIRKKTFELTILNEVTNAISYTLEYKQFFSFIMASLNKMVNYDICASIVLEDDDIEMTIKPRYIGSEVLTEEVREKIIYAVSLLTGKNIALNQIHVNVLATEEEPLAKMNGMLGGMEIRSFFNTPFIVNGKIIGLINVSSCTQNAFSESDLKFIYTIANQAGRAIEQLKSVIMAEKAKMESMVASMAEGVIMIDELGRIVVMNPKAKELLGINSSRKTDIHFNNNSTGIIDLDAGIKECRKENEAIVKDLPMNTDTGKSLRASISPVKTGEGNILGVVIFLRDITEEKESLRLKTEFISTVSHELRTPLTTIREGVSQVLDGVLGDTTNAQKEFLSISLEDIDRLTRIINNLLDISKIESGKITLKRELTDINEIIKNIKSSFAGQASKKGLDIFIDVPNEPLLLYVDKDKIIQLFTNLVNNAIKFTNKGYITISARSYESMVECSVSDTGIGIEEDDIPKVFEKFQQFKRIDSAGEKGTGLGLSIVKNIVGVHGGKIKVESSGNNKGAKFIFTLPVYNEDERVCENIFDILKDAINHNRDVAVLYFGVKEMAHRKENSDDILLEMANMIRAKLRHMVDNVITVKNKIIVIIANMNKKSAVITAGRFQQALEEYLLTRQECAVYGIKCKVLSYPVDGKDAYEILGKIDENFIQKVVAG
ncbi:protein containing ATP-binding region, ATPase-like protein [Candidatus Omnitrophus magneticus]|uniref:histidine kinase n=1 Tax=Candidatus Omnitrophus magneticus TaxID=1609969 RepID=A0A0F0CKA1_9BACT|nr:protein containing ATP-binding region, ATPase-like protein [Candidatus Omnitrophus magneticus]